MVAKWLITGGCGFIGTSLIKRLLQEQPDAHIRVLDNLTAGTRDDLAEVCEFSDANVSQLTTQAGVFLIPGDIRDVDLSLAVGKDIECIVHLAANTGVGPSVENPRDDMESNIIGIFNMLESARINKVKQFVFASSGAPAGVVEPPIHEEVAPHPVSPYGASKLAGEGYCSSYYQTFGINTVALRFGNVYGPRSKKKSSVVAKFIRQALNGEVCEIYGDGTQTRDFIYIGDLIDAIMKASCFDGGGEIFQIATGVELTLNEMVSELKEVFERETGQSMHVEYGDTRLGDVLRNYSDISKAKNTLGWLPETPLQKGLHLTVSDLMQS
jgi:UDP-glucose 4-epimerase